MDNKIIVEENSLDIEDLIPSTKTKKDSQKPIGGIRLLLGYLGIFICFMSVALVAPCLVVIFYQEEVSELKNFLIPALACFVIGLLLSLLIYQKKKMQLQKGEDALLLVSIWVVNTIISAVPFMMYGFNFTQAIFETTSGLTTTGLTIVDVANASHIMLMYRSVLQFLGGVGLVLIITATISDRYGLKLYSAEGHSDKLLPNMAKSARLILSIYACYIILGTIMFCVFGMPVFDAINHSICAIATGGFSTQSASIGAYNSIGIEIVAICLMILGNTNFLIHACILRGKFKNVIKHGETLFSVLMILIAVPIFMISFHNADGSSFWHSFRLSIFHVVSSFTTTGYQTIPAVNGLPVLLIFSIIILMTIGGNTGSTAGGLKQYRLVIMFKGMGWDFSKRLRKSSVVETHFVNYAGKYIEVTDQDVKKSNDYILMYLLILLIGTLIVTGYGYNIQDSLFEVASAFSSGGLSIGVTNFNAPKGVLWVLSIVMFLGRLEIFIVFSSFIKSLQMCAKEAAHFVHKKNKAKNVS